MEMHTLLSSALESSTKSTDKLNTLKVKLVNSENLVAVLTQKVKLYFFQSFTKLYISYYYLFIIFYFHRILIKLLN